MFCINGVHKRKKDWVKFVQLDVKSLERETGRGL